MGLISSKPSLCSRSGNVNQRSRISGNNDNCDVHTYTLQKKLLHAIRLSSKKAGWSDHDQLTTTTLCARKQFPNEITFDLIFLHFFIIIIINIVIIIVIITLQPTHFTADANASTINVWIVTASASDIFWSIDMDVDHRRIHILWIFY